MSRCLPSSLLLFQSCVRLRSCPDDCRLSKYSGVVRDWTDARLHHSPLLPSRRWWSGSCSTPRREVRARRSWRPWVLGPFVRREGWAGLQPEGRYSHSARSPPARMTSSGSGQCSPLFGRAATVRGQGSFASFRHRTDVRYNVGWSGDSVICRPPQSRRIFTSSFFFFVCDSGVKERSG